MDSYEETEWIEMRDDEDENESYFTNNMFANPDPYQTFIHHFDLPHHQNIDQSFSSISSSPPPPPPTTTTPSTTISITLIGRRADEAQLLSSTGLTLWRAAPMLCHYLISNSKLYVQNKTILELGAGLGLCSILTAILGASTVVISDGDSISLSNLRENVERNKHLIPNFDQKSQNIQCLQLRWGMNLEEFKMKCNLPTVDGLFEVILGSDIIYIESILQPLFLTIDTLLTSHGTFILAYARRNVKIDLVFEVATKYGFEWTEPTSEEGCFIFQRVTKSVIEEEQQQL